MYGPYRHKKTGRRVYVARDARSARNAELFEDAAHGPDDVTIRPPSTAIASVLRGLWDVWEFIGEGPDQMHNRDPRRLQAYEDEWHAIHGHS